MARHFARPLAAASRTLPDSKFRLE